MLEPEDRSLLLDALRPPDGYQLDRAVGTTFSLNLDTLLTAPLAFAMFDAETTDGGVPDVIALIEATRRYAGQISLFCQAGRIALPTQHQPVFANIEGTVHEAVAPHPSGIFHPKVWALRYVSPDGDDPQFRILVLSRNLTFDRSWDTILRLDGSTAKPADRPAARQRNTRLARFLRQLPAASVRPLPGEEREAIEELARQFSTVSFEMPGGVNDIEFWPLGLGDDPSEIVTDEHERALVISPFLSEPFLRDVGEHGSRHVLVSRSEALDAISPEVLELFEHVYVLDAAADGAESDEGEDSLSGLHAKTYVFEIGRAAYVLTGSANATSAALDRNVEFLAELTGRRDRIGIDTIIASDENSTTLADLLVPYARSEEAPGDSDLEELERSIDKFRHDLARIPLGINVEALDTANVYSLRISSSAPLPSLDGTEVSCRPIALSTGSSRAVTLGESLDAEFPRVSFEAITAFIAFDVTARRASHTRTTSFVVTAELRGAPANRHQRILSALLDNKAKVLRYLLFLLSDPTSDPGTLSLLHGARSVAVGDGHTGVADIPLLETLLRTLSRNPLRLDAVDRLIRDLGRTDDGAELLPPGIHDVWGPIWAMRKEATDG